MSEKSRTQLTIEERYTIEILLQEGYTQNTIASRIGRDKSVVCRELRRNTGENGSYSASIAIKLTAVRRRRTVSSKFSTTVREVLVEKLKLNWSPQDISAYLKLNAIASISHELIYQYINDDRLVGGYLYTLLPRRGKKYKKRNVKNKKTWKKAPKRKSISEREDEANQRSEIGHWEGDTVEGKGHRN